MQPLTKQLFVLPWFEMIYNDLYTVLENGSSVERCGDWVSPFGRVTPNERDNTCVGNPEAVSSKGPC